LVCKTIRSICTRHEFRTITITILWQHFVSKFRTLTIFYILVNHCEYIVSFLHAVHLLLTVLEPFEWPWKNEDKTLKFRRTKFSWTSKLKLLFVCSFKLKKLLYKNIGQNIQWNWKGNIISISYVYNNRKTSSSVYQSILQSIHTCKVYTQNDGKYLIYHMQNRSKNVVDNMFFYAKYLLKYYIHKNRTQTQKGRKRLLRLLIMFNTGYYLLHLPISNW
jgi:hypothetical protein